MGRQVNFCMHPDEEETFLTFLESMPSLKILLNTTTDENLIINCRELLHFPNSQVYIFNEAWGIEPAYAQKTETLEYDFTSKQWISTNNCTYRVMNLVNAPLIEYCRSKINNKGMLTSGRIWAEMYRIEEDQFIEKDVEFIKQYEKIARWLKKSLRFEKDSMYYLSPMAEEWFAKQGN